MWHWLEANGLNNDVVFTVVGWSIPAFLAFLAGKHVWGQIKVLWREHIQVTRDHTAATTRLAAALESKGLDDDRPTA